MNTHLICYADERFRYGQTKLVKSARKYGLHNINAFSPNDLRKTKFYKTHRQILDQSRGAGYWLWKPYFIAEALKTVSPGDFVLYVDSGATIISSIDPLIDVCERARGILLFRNHGRSNRYWTKRDCYSLMGCDSDDYYSADQVNGAFCGFIATSGSQHFVDVWLNYCTDPRILTDIANEGSLPNLPDFLCHRHDQSVISLLAIKNNIHLHRDPSQSGNHLKAPKYRETNESLELPYSTRIDSASMYPTLFDHSRTTTRPPSIPKKLFIRAKSGLRHYLPKTYPTPQYFNLSHLASAVRKNRDTLEAVPSWFDLAADKDSQFGYGLPPVCQHLISKQIRNELTLPDLIVHLLDHLVAQANYLEIGVSVGKTFTQVLRSGSYRQMTAFDIEEMHPNLVNSLVPLERVEWNSSPDSLKRRHSSLTKCFDPIGNNTVQYLSGDVLDPACWSRLQGKTFNLIYSDALHRPEGLMYEWSMIESHALLNRDEFVVIWDDLNGVMSLAFDRISERVKATIGPCVQLKFKLWGWMGTNEYPHEVGLLAKLPNPPAWMSLAAGRTPQP